MLYSLLFALASLSSLTSTQRIEKAVTVLQPDQTNPIRGLRNVRGIVTFERINHGKNRGNTRVSGEIRGLKPHKKHGFHVHEFGDISSGNMNKPINCLSTGGHYDPFNKKFHADRNNKNSHLGDLGNIKANKNGVARFEFIDRFIRLNGDSSIVGRGIVVHERRDDLKSQPVGNAGGRPSCGVIGIADNQRKGRNAQFEPQSFETTQDIETTDDYSSDYDSSDNHHDRQHRHHHHHHHHDMDTTEEPETTYQHDQDCLASAGYSWCESLGECIKSWETHCCSFQGQKWCDSKNACYFPIGGSCKSEECAEGEKWCSFTKECYMELGGQCDDNNDRRLISESSTTSEPTMEPTIEPTMSGHNLLEKLGDLFGDLLPRKGGKRRRMIGSTPSAVIINARIQETETKRVLVSALNGHCNGLVVTVSCTFHVSQISVASRTLSLYYMNVAIRCNGEVRTAQLRFKWSLGAQITSIQFISLIGSDRRLISESSPTSGPTMEPTIEPTMSSDDLLEIFGDLIRGLFPSQPSNEGERRRMIGSTTNGLAAEFNEALQNSMSMKMKLVGVVNGHGFKVSVKCNFNIIKVYIDSRTLNIYYMNIKIQCAAKIKTAKLSIGFSSDNLESAKVTSLQFVEWIN